MSQQTQASSDPNLRPLHVRSVVNSFGSGMVSPFLSIYAVQLGASSSDMGWFQSITNLAPNVMQIPWGRISDRIGRRMPFLLFGGLVTAVLWIPMMFIASAKQLVLVIAIQSILGSMTIPTWTALIGDLALPLTRGEATASLNLYAALGSLFATLLSGFLMATTSGTPQQIFFIPLSMAVIFGVISSLVMLLIREKTHSSKTGGDPFFGVLGMVKQIKSAPDFSRYCLVSMIFGFFMSLCWPLFSITLVRILGASMLEIALLSVIEGAITIAFQPWAGRLVDRIGRKTLLIMYRIGLVLVPIFYAYAPSVYYLLILNGILGVFVALGNTATFAYLLDVTPKEQRGSFTAFYNLATGSVYFVGSLIGGYLSDYLLGIVGVILSLQIVYLISASGRVIGALTHTSITEPYKYPSTLKRELWEAIRIRKRAR